MTAGRKSTDITIQQKPVLDGELVNGEIDRAIQSTAAVQENALALAKALGYEGSLNPDSLEEGIRESQSRVNFEVFTMGARLLLLKEQCQHGEFIERCGRLDFDRRAAYKLMMVAHKFSNDATSHHLTKLGKSKLFELAILDDDEATAFAAGETVRGITHDDAAKLSVKALREKLREADARIAAKDKVAADNQAVIQRLQEQIANRKPEPVQKPTPEFIADSALRALDNEVLTVTARIDASLRSFLVAVSAPELAVGDVIRRQSISGAIGRVLAAARQLAQDFDVPVFGVDAADGEGESDLVWQNTLKDFDAQQAGQNGGENEG